MIDIPVTVQVFSLVFTGIIEIYSKTIESQSLNTRLLAAIDKDGLPLLQHGSGRQELQSLLYYNFILIEVLMVVYSIILGAIGVVVIAGVIYFVFWLMTGVIR
ncbi:hypothetical protein BOTCAL_0868g00010 [Botryotinia calthae]|uniref:Uncharacterized protein n=1 Tax=Botryotinia calthae TaxID=38488 RepID=A0A4Y8CHY5_9HELO|nr:hypothetical protein BOTCAL_0868g00010 [Botryotinia calthae]